MDSAAETIRHWREDVAHLSQAEVAVSLRVSDGAVSQWETGRTAPRRAIAVKLDRLVKANGAILRALGYVLPVADDELAERVSQLKSGQEDLRRAVELLMQAVVTSEPLRIEIEALLVRASGADPERTAARRRAR